MTAAESEQQMKGLAVSSFAIAVAGLICIVGAALAALGLEGPSLEVLKVVVGGALGYLACVLAVTCWELWKLAREEFVD